ncbi:MAG: hypothetical protein IJS39_00560 [Synergistaceae bacterium]|nr:hypothetical protein [Synergistaceae bacterium]
MKYAVFFGVSVAVLLSAAVFTVVLANSRGVPRRRAVMYDYNGKILKEYSGKIEYVRRSGNGVRFWLDGRRIMLYGGIIIVEDE